MRLIRQNGQNKLRAYRRIKGMTLDAVAKAIGISKTTVQRYESGVIPNIPLTSIKALSKLYGISANELLDIDNVESTENILINLLENLGFECITLKSETLISDTSNTSNSNTVLIIQVPDGDRYELTTDDLITLKSDLQSYIEFQLFKLKK